MNAKRALGVVGVLLALMLALTGCVKLNMSVKVNNEKSVDYEVVYAIQKSVLGDKSFDEFMESNGTGSQGMDIPDGATVVDYEDEKYKGKRITAANLDPAKLAESSSSESPFELKRDGDFYVISMGGVTGGESGDASSSAMAKSMFDEASVTFTFPGKVVEANGATVDGNKATFDMLSVKDTVVQAKAEANAGIPMWIIWILVAVLVIAAALVLLFVLLRKRSAQQQPALAGAAPYGQPGYAAQPGYQAQQDNPVQPGHITQPGQEGYQSQPQPPAQRPQQDWAGQGYTPGAPAQQPTQPPVQRHDDGPVPPPPSAPPASGA
ncbi:LppM family (lipo)protein [Paenarthrobacter sp. NPDC091711]|uniref:LppM family (lipo)protein n=1 Tax=Paenarthrobacter sp. NPDC091711 TaxID=3364385 RepID=UPI00381C2FE1